MRLDEEVGLEDNLLRVIHVSLFNMICMRNVHVLMHAVFFDTWARHHMVIREHVRYIQLHVLCIEATDEA